MKYDMDDILKMHHQELRELRKQDLIRLAKVCGGILFVLLMGAASGYVVLRWFTDLSLNGTY